MSTAGRTPAFLVFRRLALSLSILLLAAASARAQSDTCASAPPIIDGTYTGTTAGATTDGVSACGGFNDVWYQYTAPRSCTVTVDTCGSSFDTVLTLYAGCPGTPANQIACNDDGCALQSLIDVSVTSGQVLYLRIAGFDGAVGGYTLHVTCGGIPGAPANDLCANAIPVTPGAINGTNIAASNDGTASCGGAQVSPDVWYLYTATEHCQLLVTTCGANFDTVLSIHSGCPGTIANELACNDDSCVLESSVSVEMLAGATVYIRVAGFNGNTGAFPLNVSCNPITSGPPGDLVVGDVGPLAQLGRASDVVGCAVQSIVCNAGGRPVDWLVNPDGRHPFIVSNLYRLQAGRIEQIGQSWAVHPQADPFADACSLGCSPAVGALGAGCSDTRSEPANGSQNILGPRLEIDPWTGAFAFAGSYLATHSGPFDPVEHRLQIHDADLDPAANPSATYIAEVYVVAHDDADHTNSLAYRTVAVAGSPGGTWTFDTSGSTTQAGPALNAWAGAAQTVIPQSPATDGRSILAVQATDLSGGLWHYEYALLNLDMAREVGSFSLPITADTQVSNTRFHAVESSGEGFSNAPWAFTQTAEAITWATDSFDTNPNANPLRWGTTYNFWFDANRPPADTVATLGLYRPGSPTSLSGATRGPSLSPCLAGSVDLAAGSPADVLLINGSAGAPVTRKVNVAIGAPVTVTLASSPAGPASGRYVVWIWPVMPASSRNVFARGQSLGCTVNPTPLEPSLVPQPYRCLRGGIPPRACGSVPEYVPTPPRTPWAVRSNHGSPVPAVFTIQGVIQDRGAGNALGFSVTNAVVLQIE